jgi:hypothetical protein
MPSTWHRTEEFSHQVLTLDKEHISSGRMPARSNTFLKWGNAYKTSCPDAGEQYTPHLDYLALNVLNIHLALHNFIRITVIPF